MRSGKSAIPALFAFFCCICAVTVAYAGTSSISLTSGSDTLPCFNQTIFFEDFGAGDTNPGPELPPGTTTYCYEDLTGTCPVNPDLTPGSIYDGSYSIMNDALTGIVSIDGVLGAWISITDHTPGDTNGYMLVVNADFEVGEFYRLNDIDVLIGQPYRFSAWFANILGDSSIVACGPIQAPINVRFVVEDAASGSVLGSFTTGDIYATGEPIWVQTTFAFTAASPRINIVLVNNAPGGCGNDFVIDDIELAGCIANSTTAEDDVFQIGDCDTLVTGLLSNDSDAEGHGQTVQVFLFDSDGDGVTDSTAPPGITVTIGGWSHSGELVADAASVFGTASGELFLVPEPGFSGELWLDYVVCDNGIPVSCDTARLTVMVTGCGQSCSQVVFFEDFGAGAVNPGPELPPGTTTYCYEDLTGSCPSNPGVTPGSIDDGSYSIMNDPLEGLVSIDGVIGGWISIADHTPNDTNGYMLVVNADFELGEFYRLNNIDVLPGEPYGFSAWFANILGDSAIAACDTIQTPVQVLFLVEDAATGNALGAYSTGDIFGTGEPLWVQTVFNFTATSPRINIVLVNISPGGCGNDFVIDDIMLTGCIANTTTASDDLYQVGDCNRLQANVMDNDSDAEGHVQAVVAWFYDSDGDGDADSPGELGEELSFGALNAAGAYVPDAVQVSLQENGDLTVVPSEGFAGTLGLEYILCDNGIPSVCDTATALVNIVLCPTDCPVPDIITPNGDGLNDFLYIPCAEDWPDLQLLVYNRWGNMVYDSGPGYDNSWQGTYKGRPLPEGTYYYVVQFHASGQGSLAGDLTILR